MDSDVLRGRKEGDKAVIFIVVPGYYTTALLPVALKSKTAPAKQSYH